MHSPQGWNLIYRYSWNRRAFLRCNWSDAETTKADHKDSSFCMPNLVTQPWISCQDFLSICDVLSQGTVVLPVHFRWLAVLGEQKVRRSAWSNSHVLCIVGWKSQKKKEKKPREERDISFRRFPEISRPRSPLRRAARVASRQRPRPHGGRPRLENPNVTNYERRDVFSFFFCSEMNWDEMYAV